MNFTSINDKLAGHDIEELSEVFLKNKNNTSLLVLSVTL